LRFFFPTILAIAKARGLQKGEMELMQEMEDGEDEVEKKLREQ
jgi:hypothetical protein